MVERGLRGGIRRRWELSFGQVVLPSLRVLERRSDDDDRNPLVLHRGYTGATELHDWWSIQRVPLLRRARDIEIVALGSQGHPVTGWRFEDCHLVEPRSSPLDALEWRVLTATAFVEFETATRFEP